MVVCGVGLVDALFGRQPTQDEIADHVFVVLIPMVLLRVLPNNVGRFDVCVYYTITVQIGETSEHVSQNKTDSLLV